MKQKNNAHFASPLVTRVTNDTKTLDQLFTGVVVYLFKDLFMLLDIVIVMLQLNIRLALVSFSLVPVVIIATIIFRLKAREAYREVRMRLARINATLVEDITCMCTVQVCHRMKKKHRNSTKSMMPTTGPASGN